YITRFFEDSADTIRRNQKGGKLSVKDFQHGWRVARKTKEEKTTHPLITVDGSASTAWDNRHWLEILENQRCSQPRVGPAHVVTRMNPDVRIILILRDPTQRLFSDYVYFSHREAPSRERFHEKVKAAIAAFQNCTSHKPLSLCLLQKSTVRLHLGLYHIFISNWLRVIPRGHLLVLHSETYRANVTAALEQAFRFLDLPPLSNAAMIFLSTLRERNTTKKKSSVGAILHNTDAILSEFYS
ncbi:hypothetical protein RRG08_066580, partial [Elysia crispata]